LDEYHVYVDTGKRKAGLAVLNSRRELVLAKLVEITNPTPARMVRALEREARKAISTLGGSVGSWTFEKPIKYKSQREYHKDLESLLAVIRSAKRILPEGVFTVVPRKWKGQVPKEICRARTIRILSEREMIVLGEEQHDKYDAVGIAMVQSGRLGRGCTRAKN